VSSFSGSPPPRTTQNTSIWNWTSAGVFLMIVSSSVPSALGWNS
jgi:hypothetical protein